MIKKAYLLAFVMTAVLPLVTAQTSDRVRVRLFSTNKIESIAVSYDLGRYNLYANQSEILDTTLEEGSTIFLERRGKMVDVSTNGHKFGQYTSVQFKATDTACILCMNPKGAKQRSYEGNLIVTAGNQGLLLINDVEFETYLAGVAQSEIYGDKSDIFRIQATISRTWALRNINKHKKDGYNFCDDVHCQAYQNRCVRPDIMLGTIASSGETLVDSAGNLIETPFHSNSGGQTANSEDVWRATLPYLRSVDDTFSYQMKQSSWSKCFSEARWLDYFAKNHKIDISNDSLRHELLTFSQEQRKSKLLGIPLPRIRIDLKLKSTFFSVSYDSANHQVTLYGRGYGHGVGLSQEGAIRMVRLGISYDSILRHYYTGAIIHKDTSTEHHYVQNYVEQIERIIEEDKQRNTQVKSKKDDWLGRLFRLKDQQEREETYDPAKQEMETDWEYEW